MAENNQKSYKITYSNKRKGKRKYANMLMPPFLPGKDCETDRFRSAFPDSPLTIDERAGVKDSKDTYMHKLARHLKKHSKVKITDKRSCKDMM